MKNLKSILAIFSLFLIIIISGGVITNAATNIKQITIGYFPNITHAPAIIGISEGIFKDHLNGIDIKTRIFPNGSLFMDAISTGQIDIGYVGPGPAINRFLQGADVKALASASTGGTVLITRKGLNYGTVEDLKDKVVATAALGCTHDLLFRQLIKKHDINTIRRGGSIDHRAQKPATMVGLFATNQLDAAMVSEPWAARMEADLGAKVVLDWNQVPWKGKLPAAILVSTDKYIEENKEIINKLLQAHLAAIEFIKKHPVKTTEIIQNEIKDITRQELSKDVITKSLNRTNITAELDSSVVQELADLSSELGFIKGESDLDGFIDTSFLEEIKNANSK